jgi:hypothetical protein
MSGDTSDDERPAGGGEHLRPQAGKGYGADEGEREQGLDEPGDDDA